MLGSVKKRIENSAGDMETIIGMDTTITGNLEGSDNIRIAGHIDGNVSVTGNVVITKSGSVQGDVKAVGLSVAGTLTGKVDCDCKLSVQDDGQIDFPEKR